MNIEVAIDISLLTLLVVTAILLMRLTNLLAVVLLSAIYSLLAAVLFVTLDAVDVAFTEAAVGAGITTIFMLGALAITGREQSSNRHGKLLPILVILITAGALIYGTFDMPSVGDPEAPIHNYVAPRYIHESSQEIGVPNIVTSVLASYRGFDTLGEVAVVFTAAVGVLLLLGKTRRDNKNNE